MVTISLSGWVEVVVRVWEKKMHFEKGCMLIRKYVHNIQTSYGLRL